METNKPFKPYDKFCQGILSQQQNESERLG